MQYCFVTYGNLQTNAGYFRALGLASALAKRGLSVSVVADDVAGNGDLPNLHPSVQMILVRGAGKFARARDRRQKLFGLQPDFVHVLGPTLNNLLATAGLRNSRLVVDWDEPQRFKPLGFGKRAWELSLDWVFRQRADLAIVCTKYLQEFFETELRHPVLYLPHATYLPERADGESPFAEPTIVFMGNLYPEWDHDIVIDAAEILKNRGVHAPIKILGHGPDAARVGQVVEDKQLTNVELTGYVSGDELWRHLRHAQASLFPIRDQITNKTRCPSKTFAYAQARRPVITCRVGEVGRLLGNAATYVECTPAAFADAIESVLKRGSVDDVEFGIERHNYDARAEILIHELAERFSLQTSVARKAA